MLVLKKVKSLPLFVLVLWRLEPGEVTCKSSIVITHDRTILCNNNNGNDDDDNNYYYIVWKYYTSNIIQTTVL